MLRDPRGRTDGQRRHPLAGAAALALLCGGCSSPPAPTFEVKAVTLTEEGERGYVLNFAIEGTNKGPDPLPLRMVSYSLTLDGREVFQGTRSAQATLRRFGEQTLTLPVAIPLTPPEVMPAGRLPYRFAATIEYELPGSIAELLFDSDIRRPTVGFSENGRLDFESIRRDAPAPPPEPAPTPADGAPAPTP